MEGGNDIIRSNVDLTLRLGLAHDDEHIVDPPQFTNAIPVLSADPVLGPLTGLDVVPSIYLVPAPSADLNPEPLAHPDRMPFVDPAQEPLPDSNYVLLADPAPKPFPDLNPMPFADPNLMPFAALIPIPFTDPAPMPFVYPIPEPVADPISRPIANNLMPFTDPIPELVADPNPMPFVDPIPEPIVEPDLMPFANLDPMPFADPIPVPFVDLDSVPSTQHPGADVIAPTGQNAPIASDQVTVDQPEDQPIPPANEDLYAFDYPASRRRSSRGQNQTPLYNDPSRRCLNPRCMTNDTPIWRRGPQGPRTLCNACGIKYRKVRDKKTAVPEK